MCTAAALIPAALQGASQIANYSAQSEAAAQQQDYANRKYNSAATAAQENMRSAYNQIDSRTEQEAAADAQQAVGVHNQTVVKIGQVNAAAGAAGISGNSVDSLIHQFKVIEADTQATLDVNSRWRAQQAALQKQSIQAGVQQSLTANAPQRYAGPSGLGLMLGLAGTAASGVSSYYSNQPGGLQSSWLNKNIFTSLFGSSPAVDEGIKLVGDGPVLPGTSA